MVHTHGEGVCMSRKHHTCHKHKRRKSEGIVEENEAAEFGGFVLFVQSYGTFYCHIPILYSIHLALGNHKLQANPTHKSNKMASKRFGDVLSLQVFIRRAQVIKSYRDLMRAARKCEDSNLRKDIISQIRHEYGRHKTIQDGILIKQHLQEATRELKKVKDLCQSVHLSHTPQETPIQINHSNSNNQHNSSTNYYPTSSRIDKHMNHPGASWMDTEDSEDPRGRVGEGWPWERS